jgi:cell division protease FtsH
VAEEIIFSTITSGASNDIERATGIARKMVCEWGMSEKLGPLAFGEKEGEIFLGRDMGHVKNYSEATAVEIDNEIRRIIQESYERTRKILKENRESLVKVAEALLERESLDGAEIRKMVFGDAAVSSTVAGGETVSPADGPCVEDALRPGE